MNLRALRFASWLRRHERTSMNFAQTRESSRTAAAPVAPSGPGAEVTLRRLARLAAQLCDAPCAVVAVNDQRSCWQAGQHGPGAAAGRRESALQARVIATGASLVVEDLAADPSLDPGCAVASTGNPLACAIVPVVSAAGIVVATCSVFDHVPRGFSDEQIDGLRVLAGQAAAVIHQSELQHELSALQQRELAYYELLSATHDEALRDLSNELHEGISQDISGVAMLVSAAARRAKPLDPQLATDLREIAGLLRDTIDTCRIAAEASDGFVITHSGLASALTRFVDRLEIAPTRTFIVNCDSFREDSLDTGTAQQLLRIAQDALLETASRDNGTLVHVSLGIVDAHVVLTVSENGEPDAARQSATKDDVGRAIMKYRAMAIGARLTFGADVHQRYQVRCEVPSRRQADRLAAISPWAAKHR